MIGPILMIVLVRKIIDARVIKVVIIVVMPVTWKIAVVGIAIAPVVGVVVIAPSVKRHVRHE
jgi:hypothetical protein